MLKCSIRGIFWSLRITEHFLPIILRLVLEVVRSAATELMIMNRYVFCCGSVLHVVCRRTNSMLVI